MSKEDFVPRPRRIRGNHDRGKERVRVKRDIEDQRAEGEAQASEDAAFDAALFAEANAAEETSVEMV